MFADVCCVCTICITTVLNLNLQTTRLPTPDVWLNKRLTIEALIEEDSQNFNCSVFINFKPFIFISNIINQPIMFSLFLLLYFFTISYSSCGKVMFSQVSVCTWGKGVHPLGWQSPPWEMPPVILPSGKHLSWSDTSPSPPRQTPLPWQTPPPGQTLPPTEMATAADSTHPTGMHSCCYRLGTVYSKSFVGKVLLRIKWKFELTVHFKHVREMIEKYCTVTLT